MNQRRAFLLGLTFTLVSCGLAGPAGAGVETSSGQTVYVPIYSHIYAGPKSRPINLAATFSIRNTDPEHWISVESVQYRGSDGKLIKEYIAKPVKLSPLASIRFIVEEADTTGGSGASFIVEWKADTLVSVPILQGVMISTRSQLGISFVTHGRAVRETSR
ncbi:MAG: DUF3124 domain-containing protein [Pseudomonadota bacterium]